MMRSSFLFRSAGAFGLGLGMLLSNSADASFVEFNYETDFVGANGTQPTDWTNQYVTQNTSYGIQNNKFHLLRTGVAGSSSNWNRYSVYTGQSDEGIDAAD